MDIEKMLAGIRNKKRTPEPTKPVSTGLNTALIKLIEEETGTTLYKVEKGTLKSTQPQVQNIPKSVLLNDTVGLMDRHKALQLQALVETFPLIQDESHDECKPIPQSLDGLIDADRLSVDARKVPAPLTVNQDVKHDDPREQVEQDVATVILRHAFKFTKYRYTGYRIKDTLPNGCYIYAPIGDINGALLYKNGIFDIRMTQDSIDNLPATLAEFYPGLPSAYFVGLDDGWSGNEKSIAYTGGWYENGYHDGERIQRIYGDNCVDDSIYKKDCQKRVK